jgi:DNA-binding NarL/FixJ family response regulator
MGITILHLPSVRPDLFTVLHFLQPIEEDSRLSRELRRLGAVVEKPASASAAGPEPPQPAPSLTQREREVLEWMAAGLHNKEVAHALNLSPATVRNHVHNILEKLGVHSKLEAVCLAFRNGWVQRSPALPGE